MRLESVLTNPSSVMPKLLMRPLRCCDSCCAATSMHIIVCSDIRFIYHTCKQHKITHASESCETIKKRARRDLQLLANISKLSWSPKV